MADETTNLNELSRKLDSVRAEMAATVERTRARQTRFRILTIVIALFLAAYFFFAYKQISKVDADVAMANVEDQIRKAMPQARDELEKKLKAQAPEIVDAAAQHLLGAPEAMKGTLVTMISGKVEEQVATMDDKLYETLKSQIAEMTKVVNAAHPNATDEEKVDFLLEKAAEAYRAEAKRRIDEVYKIFQTKAEDLIIYLTHLSKNQGLNETEKLHRELVETCLALTHQFYQESEAHKDGTSVLPAAP